MADSSAMAAKPTSPWITAFATTIGAAIGSAAVHGMSPDTTIRFLAGALVGAIVGFFAYRFAKRRSQEKLGHLALLTCIGAGALFGLILALPTALIFYFVIRSRSASQNAAV